VRNIFLFIQRYSTLLTFLFLQVLCIYFIASYSKYHKAALGGIANKFTGNINKQYNKLEYFFNLSRTNDSLVKANEALYNKLRVNYNVLDSTNKLVVDSIKVDTLFRFRKYNYLSAKVISNSVTSQSNFIVINGPNVKNFKPGMGVVGVNNDVVGIVTAVDGDYGVVMSLLHKDSRLSGKLYKEKESGTIGWNGELPTILSLSGISKNAKVIVGDTVVTGISGIFPKGIIIGTVQTVKAETASNSHKITLQPHVDFYNIEYVYAIQSVDAGPIQTMLDKAKAVTN
jgi:rod shape-determining protein MreC